MPLHQTAYFVVRDDALEICKNAIREFIEYVRDKERATHFLHYFILAVNRFTGILYPNLVAPLEFTEYEVFATTS